MLVLVLVLTMAGEAVVLFDHMRVAVLSLVSGQGHIKNKIGLDCLLRTAMIFGGLQIVHSSRLGFMPNFESTRNVKYFLAMVLEEACCYQWRKLRGISLMIPTLPSVVNNT